MRQKLRFLFDLKAELEILPEAKCTERDLQ